MTADDGYLNTFILSAKSDPLSVKTAAPPAAPGNIGVVATTCHSVQIGWDPPAAKGVDIIGKGHSGIWSDLS